MESVQDTLREGTILCNETDGIVDNVERFGRCKYKEVLEVEWSLNNIFV